MQVYVETKIDFNEYENFLQKNKNSPFTISSKHLLLLEKILNLQPLFFTVRKEKELSGIIPFFEKKSIFGKVVNSLPFFGSHGGVIGQDEQTQKKLLEQMNLYNIENDVLSSVIITNPFVKNHLLYHKFFNYNFFEKRLTQCINLKNKTIEKIWNDLEKRVRWTIRKGQKNLVSKIVNLDDQIIADFYHTYKVGMEIKGGRLKPPEFFNYVKTNLKIGKDYDVIITYRNSTAVSYLLVFYYGSFAEYYMPAFKKEWSHLHGTTMSIWKSIERSIDKNIEYYNFGGTLLNQKDLYLFKRGWNSTDYHYYYYIYADSKRLQNMTVEDIKTHYENFYIISFDELQKLQNLRND